MAVRTETLEKLQNNKYIDGKEFGELFMDIVNVMGNKSQDFSDVVTREHRFLQQEAFNLFFWCIEKWSKHESFDARNEYTIKASKVMIKALIDNGLF